MHETLTDLPSSNTLNLQTGTQHYEGHTCNLHIGAIILHVSTPSCMLCVMVGHWCASRAAPGYMGPGGCEERPDQDVAGISCGVPVAGGAEGPAA